MKKLTTIFSLLIISLITSTAFGQNGTANTTTTTTSTTTEEVWYVQPWAWVAGGVVLLIILISLFRGKSSGNTTDSVTYTKTVRRDEDI